MITSYKVANEPFITILRGLAPWKVVGEPAQPLVDLGKLQQLAAGPGANPQAAGVKPGISNVKGWSGERIRERQTCRPR